MEDNNKDEAKIESTESTLLDYGHTPLRISTERVAEIYASGTKFWTKSDLIDIERQLEQSFTLDRFTIKGLDGKIVQIKNPGFGVKEPIWKPYVKYQDYWILVLCPNGPPETYYCPFIIDWRNMVEIRFRGSIEDWQDLFLTRKQLWNNSISCKLFKSQFRELIQSHSISKIVCFGLGDFFFNPSAYVEYAPGEERSEGYSAKDPSLQHAVALTMAEEIRRYTPEVRLIAQDPSYMEGTAEFLQHQGFEIAGTFGAGGFAEVDDQSIVFTAWPAAPIKQIIADVAQPAIFITSVSSKQNTPLNSSKKPYLDPDSPRTNQMLTAYERTGIRISSVETEMMKGINELQIFTRRQNTTSHLSS